MKMKVGTYGRVVRKGLDADRIRAWRKAEQS